MRRTVYKRCEREPVNELLFTFCQKKKDNENNNNNNVYLFNSHANHNIDHSEHTRTASEMEYFVDVHRKKRMISGKSGVISI